MKTRLPPETGVAVVVLLCYTWLASFLPSFRTGATASVVLSNSAEIAILASGMTLVIATGGIDVSVGSVLGLCAIVFARLMAEGSWSIPAAAAACLAAGATCGWINGILIARYRLPSIVATLAIFAAARAGAYLLSGGESISSLPEGLIRFGYGSIGGLPLPALPAIAALVACAIILKRTAYGRQILALGGSREASFLSGHRVQQVECGVFVMSGLLAGLAAIITVARGATAIPDAGRFTEMTAITAVVLGGTPVSGGNATILGTGLGVLTIGLITNGVRAYGRGDIWVLLVLGLALLVSVEVDRWRSRERSTLS